MALAKAINRQAGAPAPEDRLSRADFQRLARHIHAVAGIKMPDSKTVMLEGRLRRRVRATDTRSIAGYCNWLFEGDNLVAEERHLINAVTTNKTDFFREPKHFDYLQATILPQIAAAGKRRIRAWSAACSTGAEPYTMAMVLDAFASDRGGPEYGILATDLDTEVLETARRGVFPAAMVDPVPAVLRSRYVLKSSLPGRDAVRMAPELRGAIGFAPLNLMDATYPVGEPMDLIFCRNVLIYFEKEAQGRVVSRLLDRLKPGGHLFLGHSESIAGFDLPVTAVANTVFRKN
ncbi:MAG: chemotaxis protein CheR [Sphingomonas fennica]